ncbi:hypothetical protein EX30DRAFT_297530, partial [Ascodesmis nigricans]
IIAVTGLAGHALGSWRSSDRHTVWLRDFLPRDIPTCRILTFGYESTVQHSVSVNRFQHYGKQLLERLREVRDHDDVRDRPIIFVGHSLGGILI